VASSTISENSTSGIMAFGGGIAAFGTASVSDSTISENSTTDTSIGGGLFAAGSLSVTGSTISGNSANLDGGGICMGGAGSTLTINSSTISGNVATLGSGGGISTNGVGGTLVTIDSSTISGNTASLYGGGISMRPAAGAPSTISRSTITGNSTGGGGGGIAVTMTGARTLALDHSIVADNSDSSGYGPDLFQVFTGVLTANHSLIGDSTGSAPVNVGGTSLIGTAAAPIDPMLGALADNGGPTMTHALLGGSPAIDAGDLAAMAGMGGVPDFDQRGAPFGRVNDGDGMGGAQIDLGAFESPDAPALPADFNGDSVANAADYVVLRKFFGMSGLLPYSFADGNGDGDIDQDDDDVWRLQFGQMPPAPSPSPSIEASAAALMAQQAAGSNTEQGVRAQREPVHVEFVGPSASYVSPYRPAKSSSRSEIAAAAVNRHDEALLVWLEQRESPQNVSDWQESGLQENEEMRSAGDLPFASVDQVFALLSNG
jgi:hypothetical protein